MRQAALGVRQVSFELGGKNPAIVFADADLDKAIEGTMRSCFSNCGQVCLGTERVYVERPIFDAFVARLKAGAESLRLGRPEDPATNLGPLVSQEHREKVLSYYKKAAEEGATVVTGGGIPEMPAELAEGAWVEPTIWTGLPDDAAVVSEEIFGPCCHIRPFDTEEEAIRLANDTPYGLAAAVWTENLGARASRRRANGSRHLLGQLLVPARPAHRLRRRQAVGHRPRRRPAFARVLHRTHQRLHQAVSEGMDTIRDRDRGREPSPTRILGGLPHRQPCAPVRELLPEGDHRSAPMRRRRSTRSAGSPRPAAGWSAARSA